MVANAGEKFASMMFAGEKPRPLLPVIAACRFGMATSTPSRKTPPMTNAPMTNAPMTNAPITEASTACGADSRDGQDAGEQVDPAGEPGVAPAGQVLGPLEHRARDRVVAGDLGEVQRDEELAQGHHRPGPDEHAAESRQAECEESEDASGRRDIAERK